jgi:hypothetical protein
MAPSRAGRPEQAPVISVWSAQPGSRSLARPFTVPCLRGAVPARCRACAGPPKSCHQTPEQIAITMSSAAKSHAASEVRNIRLRNNLDAKLTDGWPRAAPTKLTDGWPRAARPEQLRAATACHTSQKRKQPGPPLQSRSADRENPSRMSSQ